VLRFLGIFLTFSKKVLHFNNKSGILGAWEYIFFDKLQDFFHKLQHNTYYVVFRYKSNSLKNTVITGLEAFALLTPMKTTYRNLL